MVMSLKMNSCSFNQQSNLGIMDEQSVYDDHGCKIIATSSSISDDDSSVVSSDLDVFDEVNSSGSSSPTDSSSGDHSTSPSSDQFPTGTSPLQDMSSLLQQLPFKRGLSKHYNGKSQSFTCLANVKSLEDLAKPENAYNKKLKSCKSYGGFLESHVSSLHHTNNRSNTRSKLMSKKASKGSCGSLCVEKTYSFTGNRPPVPPPHKSSTRNGFNTQTPLFALAV